MSKESEAILKSWKKGDDDRRLKNPYANPYKKNSMKHKAYRSGYNEKTNS